MALQDTNLIIQSAPIPATFTGTPDDFRREIVRRMKIVSPTGTNFIFVGDNEPTSNVGPWLKGGKQWWVWDEDIKRYVPLDISASETVWFHIGASTPATSDPSVWLRTTQDPSEADPSVGSPIGWYVFNGAAWISFVGIVLSGPTSSRPTSPVALQQFYDTDISTLIWFERNQWRTIAGSPGDTKFVALATLTEALTANPGWAVFGAGNQSLRGRLVSMATKDPGATPETELTVGTDIAERAAFETFGEGTGLMIDNTPPNVEYPGTIALWFLVKE
jgi:hypothetical protein